ncbi:DinI-like family protein [Yersinia pseudotuberculosis]|uniref:DinI-like family protein n=1 Tax=Yersinia pseudotuberculosis TaxID=633 RepID=UPI0005DD0883|nr:DinI-like family protein [Yersinia pseudotuberculosis]BET64634.1 DinI family protein [Yersinia pseudotuberculosis]CNF91817.1 putative stress response protein [Yersinia pseudotuberculosis]CNL03166.1 putative stress response protein [Yersinia pseudotuberculosis]
MRVELIYDKRNVGSLANATEIIRAELTKRVHRIFPDAEVNVKAMHANGINTNASKQEKSVLNRLVEEMFDEADEWLNNEF